MCDYDGYFDEAHKGAIRTMSDARRYLDRLNPHLDLQGFDHDHRAYAAARAFFGAVAAEVDARIGEPVSPPVLEAMKDMEKIASDCYVKADEYAPPLPRYMLECKPIYAR